MCLDGVCVMLAWIRVMFDWLCVYFGMDLRIMLVWTFVLLDRSCIIMVWILVLVDWLCVIWGLYCYYFGLGF